MTKAYVISPERCLAVPLLLAAAEDYYMLLSSQLTRRAGWSCGRASLGFCFFLGGKLEKKKTMGGGCDLPAEVHTGNWPSVGQLRSGVCLCVPLN